MSPKSTTALEEEAAEILRSVDFQAAEMNRSALDAARESEEARRNARLAADMIRRFKNPHSPGRGRNHLAASQFSNKSAPSSPRRTAEEKLLSLGLEFERCQRALAQEMEEHAATKEALSTIQATEKRLREDLEKLLQNQETLREDLGRQNDELQRELDATKQRLSTAEQDAELALKLAQSNAQTREEIEVWYQQCLERNHELDNALQKYLSLQNGDDTSQLTITNHPEVMPASPDNLALVVESPAKATSSMVATGLRLLEQSLGKPVGISPAEAAEREAERRRYLTERLSSFQENVPIDLTSINSLGHLTIRISKLLQESGRRLSLPGHWWAKTSEAVCPSEESTENLVKHYCYAVETLVEQKQKEVFELESLCALMEDGDGSTPA